MALRNGNFIPVHPALLRRSVVERGVRFDQQLDAYEDWDFWLQLSREGELVHVDQANRVVVGGRDDALRGQLRLRDVNWLAAAEPGTGEAQVQIRSRYSARPAAVTLDGGGGADVEFVEPVMAPAPGQAAVCYDGDRVLGGGWIVSAT